MVEIFHMQKDEANQLYSRFIDRNYDEKKPMKPFIKTKSFSESARLILNEKNR